MTRKLCLLLGALLMSMQVRAGTPDRSLFPFTKDLTAPDDRSNTLAVVLVDEEVLGATDNRYANLRVLTDTQTEAPFLVRTRRVNRRGTQEVEVLLETVSLRTRADNAIEVLLRRVKDADEPAVLQFHTQARNFFTVRAL